MDAFAARQIEKKRLIKLQEKIIIESNEKERNSPEKQLALNRIFGIQDPPVTCYAVG